MNPSGGLRWHWRAWRSQAAWQGTREHIAQWLGSVQPRATELLVLGASAGWMLPGTWLTRFERVDLWDLDPLAPGLFGRRHGPALKAAGVRWCYHRGDALADWPRLLAAHPYACVYFDNLLGQLRFHTPGPTPQALAGVERRLATLTAPLAGREWGSLHDLLSGPGRAVRPGERVPMRSHRLRHGPPSAQDPWLAGLGPQGDWLDHLTSGVFPARTPVLDIAWPFAPGYWHWLQAGWVQDGAM